MSRRVNNHRADSLRKIVLGMLVLGHRIKEIAYFIGRSCGQVEKYREQHYRKFGVNDRAGLIRATWSL
jgi:DNA-binding NarL/FixJ family response regulator